jgi:hypothetical protein
MSTSYTFAPTALDADGICASQTLGGAGNLTIAGALASGGVATLGEQAHVTLYSTANYSAVTFTIYGTDTLGRSISETMAGPNNSTVTSLLNYKTVTRIASSGALATAIIAGNSNALETPWIRLNPREPVKAVSVEMSSGASFTYEVQWANRPLSAITTNESDLVAFADSTLTAKSASAMLVTTSPVEAARVKITSFVSGTGTLRVTEQGYS